MAFNLKQSQQTYYPLLLNGKVSRLTEEQIGKLIKKKMRSNRAIMTVFDDFDVSPELLEKLQIEITDLDDRFAETDEEKMSLDKSLMEDGKFFQTSFFVVALEIVQ